MSGFRRYLLITAALCTVAASAGAAKGPTPKPHKQAAKHHAGPGHLFAAADANGDKKLTLEELHAKVPKFPEARFKALDKNHDGALEPGELAARRKAEAGEFQKRLQAADTDRDGKISAAEFRAKFPKAPEARFATMDKNKDGFLEMAELRPHGNAKADGFHQRLRAADTDHDGKISAAEFRAKFPKAPEARFAAMDKNKDGFLDRQDRQMAKAAKKGHAAKPNAGAKPKVHAKADAKPKAGATPKKDAKPKAHAKAGATGKAKGHHHAKRAAGAADSPRYAAHLLAKFDANHDGMLTLEELKAVKHGFPESTFAELDRNKDGSLSKADFPPAGHKAKPKPKPAAAQ